MRTGIPAAAGTAAIEDTPGHDFGLDPASQGSPPHRLARRRTVAALQANDVEARAAVADEQLVQRLLIDPSRDHPRVVGASSTSSARDEAIVHEHVARPDQVEPARRDQPGSPGRLRRGDGHPSSSRTMPAK